MKCPGKLVTQLLLMLIRSGFLRFVVRRALLEDIDKVTTRCRHDHVFASDDFLGFDGAAIDLFAGIVIGTKGSAFN